MTNIDKFIRDHADLFDDQEPAEGHFERFEKRLQGYRNEIGDYRNEIRESHPVRLWMKIAAGIVILITAGLAIFDLATKDFSGRTTLQQAALGLPDDIADVLAIYESRSSLQMKELNRLAEHCPHGARLVQSTREELDQFNRNMDQLVTALKENPSDNRIQNALIQNCKAKESLLNDVILQEKIKKCNP